MDSCVNLSRGYWLWLAFCVGAVGDHQSYDEHGEVQDANFLYVWNETAE